MANLPLTIDGIINLYLIIKDRIKKCGSKINVHNDTVLAYCNYYILTQLNDNFTLNNS